MSLNRHGDRHDSSCVAGPPTFDDLVQGALASASGPPKKYSEVGYTASGKELDAALLADAARARGMRVLALPDSMQMIGDGPRRVGFFQNMSWQVTALDRIASNDKDLTKRILRRQGIPVAEGSVVTTLGEALEVARKLGFPVVVKPVAGFGGKGVTVDVHSDDELTRAWADATDVAERVLIEESITSIDIRVMVVDGRAVAAALRVPAHVEGDGVSSIGELVRAGNRVRATNPYLRNSPVEITGAMRRRLAGLGLTEQSVLEIGRRVFFHYKANLGAGGDSYDVSKLVHPSVARIAERAAACFPSARHAGIDLLIERFDRAVDGQRVVVSEVNLNNDLPMHVFPLFGEPVDVADRLIATYVREPGSRPSPEAAPIPAVPADAPTDVKSWPALVEALAEPIRRDGEPRVNRSVRALDRRHLKHEMDRLIADEIRFRERLIFFDPGSETFVAERSGTSIFAARVSRRPDVLEKLLSDAGVPVRKAPEPGTVVVDLLLVTGHEVMSLALCPFGVVGDGHSAVGELRDVKVSARARHPYLRFEQDSLGNMPKERDSEVPGAGSWVQLGRSPANAEGVDTVGFARCPIPGLAEIARRVWRLIGTPPLLAVTFAAAPSPEQALPRYAVAAVASDPVLAPFAFPWAGEQVPVYQQVARLLVDRPRLSLGRENAIGPSQ